MTRVALVLVVAVVACVRPPEKLAGQFEQVSVHDAQAAPREGAAVRWGGTLIGARPEQGRTCFEVASFPLDAKARPKPADESPGRFVACAPGFYEPAVYAPGREITVTGALDGTVTGRVGQYDYTFPRVDATTVYLWPERTPEEAHPTWWPSIGIGIGGVF